MVRKKTITLWLKDVDMGAIPYLVRHEVQHYLFDARSIRQYKKWIMCVDQILEKHGMQPSEFTRKFLIGLDAIPSCYRKQYMISSFKYFTGKTASKNTNLGGQYILGPFYNESHSETGAYIYEKDIALKFDNEFNFKYIKLYMDLYERIFGMDENL